MHSLSNSVADVLTSESTLSILSALNFPALIKANKNALCGVRARSSPSSIIKDYVFDSYDFWFRSKGSETKRYSHKIRSIIWRCLLGSLAWLYTYCLATSLVPNIPAAYPQAPCGPLNIWLPLYSLFSSSLAHSLKKTFLKTSSFFL